MTENEGGKQKKGRKVRGRMGPPPIEIPIDSAGLDENPEFLQSLLQRGGRLRAQLGQYGIRLDVQAVPDPNGNLDVQVGMSAQMLIAMGEALVDALQSHIVEPFPARFVAEAVDPEQN